MNTSCELISTQHVRRHASDRSAVIEPKSRRLLATDMIAGEHLPMVAVAGTSGRATVTRMVAHVGDYMGFAVGLTSTSACGIEADVAVFMDAGACRSEQGVIDGASITQAVREGGTLILNADDPTLRSMDVLDSSLAGGARTRVVFFAMGPTCPVIEAHRAAGGLAYVLRDGWIVEVNGASERRVVRVTDMPVTLGGAARFQIVNALAAVAAARAAGFGLAEVSCALKTFESSAHNPGKGDFYQVRGGYVLLDDAHTYAALEALCDTVSQWPARRLTCVLSVLGDHHDSAVKLSGLAAARSFDRLLIKDSRSLRGREPGQVPAAVRQAISAELPGYPCDVIADEDEAVARAIAEMMPGEVVVVISDSPERVKAILDRNGAAPARAFEREDVPMLGMAA